MDSNQCPSDTTMFSDLSEAEESALSGGSFWSWARKAWNDFRNFLSEHPITIPGTKVEVGSSGAMERAPGDFGVNVSGKW